MARFFPGQSNYVEELNNLVQQVETINPSGSAIAITATSASSLTIGTGTKSLIIQTGRSYVIGQWLIIVQQTNSTNHMIGQVTAHNSTTGELSINAVEISGSGTFTNWTVALTGTPGADGLNGKDGGLAEFYVGGNGILGPAIYEYAVAAWNNTGMSMFSNVVEITTTGLASSVANSWTQVSGALGYKIMRRVKGTVDWFAQIIDGVTSHIDIGATGVAQGNPPSNGGGLTPPVLATPRTISHAAGVNPRGAWASTTAFVKNDVCTYAGSAWLRKISGTTSTVPSSDNTNWELFVAKGADGTGGGGLASLVSATITTDQGTVTFPTRDTWLTANRTSEFLRASSEVNMAEFLESEKWNGSYHTKIQEVLDRMFDLALIMEPHSNFERNFKNKYMTAYFPMGDYPISEPIHVPDFINIKCYGQIFCSRGSGPGSSTLSADPYYPGMTFSHQAYCEKLQYKGQSDDIYPGNGIVFGQSWAIKSVTTTGGSVGTAYPASQTFTARLINGERGRLHGEYENAPVTVTTNASGQISAISLQNGGAYRTRPSGQPGYTAPTAITGTGSNGKSNMTVQYITYNAEGVETGRYETGMVVATWMDRYTGTGQNAHWNCGRDYMIHHGKIGDVEVTRVGETFDAIKGPMFGVCSHGMNVRIDQIMTQFGYYGIDFFRTVDTHANFLNYVGSIDGIRWKSGGAFTCPAIVGDSPANRGLVIDDYIDLTISGHLFSINSNDTFYNGGTVIRTETISIGQYSGNSCSKMTINMMMEQMGHATNECPALWINRCRMSQINLLVCNAHQSLSTQSGFTFGMATKTHKTFAKIGPDVGSDVYLTGSFDNIADPFKYTGTGTPVCGINVYDGTAREQLVNQTRRQITWSAGLGT